VQFLFLQSVLESFVVDSKKSVSLTKVIVDV
jgi:hypothetical protein